MGFIFGSYACRLKVFRGTSKYKQTAAILFSTNQPFVMYVFAYLAIEEIILSIKSWRITFVITIVTHVKVQCSQRWDSVLRILTKISPWHRVIHLFSYIWDHSVDRNVLDLEESQQVRHIKPTDHRTGFWCL